MASHTMPPLKPEKTASGIIVDPRTLERVVPSSKRADGTVRKEQRVRAGYVPQEDVGSFRPRRQADTAARRAVVPGSGGRASAAATAAKADNPFAQPPAEAAAKSKAQLKNEKRRAAKRAGDGEGAGKSRNWDSESDGDEGGAEEARRALGLDDDAGKRAASATVSESKSGAPEPGGAPVAGPEQAAVAPTGATDVAAPPADDAPETAAEQPGAPGATIADIGGPPPARQPESASGPAWRKNGAHTPSSSDRQGDAAKPASKPHPIQGGRKGPLGLAHPPAPVSDRPRGKPRTTPGAGGAGAAPAKTERVRPEVRIRQGGANDLGSLASRVRNLVLDTQGGGGGGRKKKEDE